MKKLQWTRACLKFKNNAICSANEEFFQNNQTQYNQVKWTQLVRFQQSLTNSSISTEYTFLQH